MIPESVGQDVQAVIPARSHDFLHRLPPSPAAVREVFEIMEKRLPIGIDHTGDLQVRIQRGLRRTVHGNAGYRCFQKGG
ncbi:Uncharacterised protein [uncultured Blautia sp.]|nr:Uncharacterised protein [uncultured Blautia sp.]